MHPRNGADVSGQWAPPAHGSRDQNPPTIGVDHITAGPPYTAVDDQAFPVAAARTWNDLPFHVTSASSLPVFRSRLKTLLALIFVTFAQCLRSDSCQHWHYDRSFYLLTYLLTIRQSKLVQETGKAGDRHHRRLQGDDLYLFQQLSVTLQKRN